MVDRSELLHLDVAQPENVHIKCHTFQAADIQIISAMTADPTVQVLRTAEQATEQQDEEEEQTNAMARFLEQLPGHETKEMSPETHIQLSGNGKKVLRICYKDDQYNFVDIDDPLVTAYKRKYDDSDQVDGCIFMECATSECGYLRVCVPHLGMGIAEFGETFRNLNATESNKRLGCNSVLDAVENVGKMSKKEIIEKIKELKLTDPDDKSFDSTIQKETKGSLLRKYLMNPSRTNGGYFRIDVRDADSTTEITYVPTMEPMNQPVNDRGCIPYRTGAVLASLPVDGRNCFQQALVAATGDVNAFVDFKSELQKHAGWVPECGDPTMKQVMKAVNLSKNPYELRVPADIKQSAGDRKQYRFAQQQTLVKSQGVFVFNVQMTGTGNGHYGAVNGERSYVNMGAVYDDDLTSGEPALFIITEEDRSRPANCKRRFESEFGSDLEFTGVAQLFVRRTRAKTTPYN